MPAGRLDRRQPVLRSRLRRLRPEIRAQLVDARNRGTAVLLISEDLDKLHRNSSPICCVMFEGAIVFETQPRDTDSMTLGRYMAGHA